MPFLTRGKARARQNRPPAPPKPPAPPVVEVPPTAPPAELKTEEEKISYQEVSYRVPKEERLLDLPLEEEVFGEQNVETEEEEEGTYTAQPVDQPVSIGIALKKKKRRL